MSLVGPPSSQPERRIVWNEVAAAPSVGGNPPGRGAAWTEGAGIDRSPREHAPDALGTRAP
eukprot:4377235-Pyramimonas_sp.AAC.1